MLNTHINQSYLNIAINTSTWEENTTMRTKHSDGMTWVAAIPHIVKLIPVWPKVRIGTTVDPMAFAQFFC